MYPLYLCLNQKAHTATASSPPVETHKLASHAHVKRPAGVIRRSLPVPGACHGLEVGLDLWDRDDHVGLSIARTRTSEEEQCDVC